MSKTAPALLTIVAALTLLGVFGACNDSGEVDTLYAYLLVDELRQTSDDLTRMARLYSVTGEDTYRDYFQRILAIRNGVVARPSNPNIAYWDLAITAGEMPPTDGRIASLRDLLEDAGLSSRQLDLVRSAEERSNALAALEANAFGRTLEEAREILHGTEYHRLKAEIMQPINELLGTLLDE